MVEHEGITPPAEKKAKSGPARGLTPKFIESLKPRASAYELADPGRSGLRLRVLPSGVKSFRWYCRTRDRVITIGRWSASEAPGFVTLAQAREWLDRLKAGHTGGEAALLAVEQSLAQSLRPQAPPPAPSGEGTVEAWSKRFVEHIRRTRKRPGVVEYVLKRDVLPRLGSMPAEAVKKGDVRDLVLAVVARGAPVHAMRVYGILRQLFAYVANLEDGVHNVVRDLNPKLLGVETNKRQRWLTEAELVTFWQVLDDEAVIPGVTPSRKTRLAMKVLLLLGSRSQELRLAKWTDIDFEAATLTVRVENLKLSPERAKSALPWVVPLPPLALSLLRELQAEADGSVWVLSSGKSDEGPFVQTATSRAMRVLWEKHPRLSGLPPAVIHDCRRTVRTWLSRLGVSPHVAEACLGHALRTTAVEAVYCVDDLLGPRRAALEKWEAFLWNLVHPAANVVRLPVAQ